MNQKAKLDKIRKIVEKAMADTKQGKREYERNKQGKIIGAYIKETKLQFQKRLEDNYVTCGLAMEKIAEILEAKVKNPFLKIK